MRILHLIPTLGTGGAERQLSYLASELVRLGHEVHVAFFHSGANVARLESSGVVLHRLRTAGNHDPANFLRIRGLIRAVDPDVVQTWLLQMDILGGAAARLAGKRWILSERSSGMTYGSGIKNRARRRLGAWATRVVSNSAGGDGYWAPVLPASRRRIIANGLPLGEIEAAAPDSLEAFGIAPDARVVLYVGRLIEGKNVAGLIEGIRILSGSENVTALFCGEGPLRESLATLAARRGIADRVRFPGNVANVWALMKRADVCAFPSEYEGCPNVVLEAMACGCPLVVSDIPAHRAVLGEGDALLVDPDDPERIAGALRQVLRFRDEALRRAGSAKRRAAAWSTQGMACRYDALYREVAGE